MSGSSSHVSFTPESKLVNLSIEIVLHINSYCLNFHAKFNKCSNFQKKMHVKFPCAILENGVPSRQIVKFYVYRIGKVCALAHMARARIIPAYLNTNVKDFKLLLQIKLRFVGNYIHVYLYQLRHNLCA